MNAELHRVAGATAPSLVARSISTIALTMERALCLGRAPFFAAVLVRFLWVGHKPPAGVLLTVLPLTVGIVFSLVVLLRVRSPPRGPLLWMASVSIDSVACVCALLPNVLWPAPQQAGITFLPDTAGLLLATVMSGFRLSLAAALCGSALSCAGLLLLVVVDPASGGNGSAGAGVSSLYVMYLLVCAMLAVILAVLTRRLADQVAASTSRAERARDGLNTLLADHHDLRSLLTAAAVDAELLRKQVEEANLGPARTTAGHLVGELRQIQSMVIGVASRALGGVTALAPVQTVDIADVLPRTVAQARSAFCEVELVMTPPAPEAQVSVAGGALSLQRMLLNLLSNACEGRDGERPAIVGVAISRDAGMIAIHVDDDGPGLGPRTSPDQPGPAPGKPGGLGVGLQLVRALAEASGGRVTLAPRPGGGARATLRLPAASAA